MRVASVCSSVGGLDLGLHRAGHETVFLCEAEPWRREVLARHWPDIPIHPDLKELSADDIPACDLFVGGTPCQDLSHAGRRAGLDGERSGLFHAFAQLRIDLYEQHGCEWSVWENVEGAFSSNKGEDFAAVLASHVGADVAVPGGGKWPRYGVVSGPWGTAEWRLLDAQFFGVPQRRRRVFVVGHLGADRAPQVLADRPRGGGDSAPSCEARTHTAGGSARGADGARRLAHTLTSGSHNGRPPGRRQEDDQNIVASALDTPRGGADDNDAQARHIVAQSLTSRYRKGVDSDAGTGQVVVADTIRSHPRPGSNTVGALAFHTTQDPITGRISPALGAETSGTTGALGAAGVRRLTPTECERLMGWPDGWTYSDGPSLLDAPQTFPGGPAPVDTPPDGRRYAACGDGVVAHVAEWIGHGLNLETTPDGG